MHRRVCAQRILFVMAGVGLLAWQASEARAQQTTTLPQGWQQMAPTDFAAAIRVLFNQGTFKSLSPADQDAAKLYGKTLFLQVDLSNSALNYQTLEMLHWVARYELEEATLDKTRAALLARQDNWAGKPYAEIRAKVVMMMRLDIPEATLINEGRRWVQGGGTLAQIPPADLNYDIVRQIFADLTVLTGSFSVQWSGQLNPPQTGNYTFSISPININSADNHFPVQYSVSLSVGGQVVLNATPKNWVSQSSAVSLTANQPTAVQMQISATVGRIPTGTMHAMLYWQGPGVNKSLIPPANLTPSGGGAQGLQATYTWKSNGQPQTFTRTDPSIDFAWTNSAILLSKDTTIANQASDAMWQAMTAPAFITSLSGPPVQLHPFLKDPDDASAGLTSARRQTFLETLLSAPALLDAANAKIAVNFYQAFRMGVPDRAFDVFSAWATRKADLTSSISANPYFEEDTRDALRKLALFTTLELPLQVNRLQNEDLQLADGSCCLPAAYALAYSYLGRGKLSDWTTFLDAKLGDPTVAGDLRVNWLLARSHAVEIEQSTPSLYAVPNSQPLAGQTYLDQANQAAKSPAVKVRVLQEIAARLVWGQQYQAAKDLLQQANSSLPAAQQAVVAALMQQIDAVAAAATQAQQDQATAGKQAYIASLQKRRDQAAAQGNSAAVDRFNALINAASAK